MGGVRGALHQGLGRGVGEGDRRRELERCGGSFGRRWPRLPPVAGGPDLRSLWSSSPTTWRRSRSHGPRPSARALRARRAERAAARHITLDVARATPVAQPSPPRRDRQPAVRDMIRAGVPGRGLPPLRHHAEDDKIAARERTQAHREAQARDSAEGRRRQLRQRPDGIEMKNVQSSATVCTGKQQNEGRPLGPPCLHPHAGADDGVGSGGWI